MSAQDQKWDLPQQSSLPQLVEARIVSAIRARDLKAGERIVETQLAKRLSVSRGPLREAIKSLEANGLVFTFRGKGTHTSPKRAAMPLPYAMSIGNFTNSYVRLPAMICCSRHGTPSVRLCGFINKAAQIMKCIAVVSCITIMSSSRR